MKSPFKLGWADYVLIALTCGLVLLVVDRLSDPVEGWFRTITRPASGGPR